jgi:hypothetical protein
MKSLAILAALLLAQVSASPDNFPSFDIFHSHCAVDVTLPGQLCTTAYKTLYDTILRFNAGADPAHGQYLFKESQPISYIWATHSSRRGWDSDVLFEPTQIGDDCQLRGRSRTMSTFHMAGTENYCDLWNVYQGLGVAYKNF